MRKNSGYRKSKAFLSRPGNIILVGLSGAGKTAIAQDLAWQIGFGFFDLDLAIETLKKKKLRTFS